MVARLQSVGQLFQLFPSSLLWNQLQHLQSRMNGRFDRWNGDGGQGLGIAASYPTVNIWEDAESVHVEAELPGLEQEDLEIYITRGNQLTIKGDAKRKSRSKASATGKNEGSAVSFVSLPCQLKWIGTR